MIKLHNTKTRRKETFVPIDAENVRMYVCGPTVYDRAHLGNARPVVVFDTLFRLLRHVYGEDHVTYVRNFTDVDDKINAKAAETGRDIRDITDETIKWYREDMDALGALPPSFEPRATEYIAPMVAMIQTLIDKGNAYVEEVGSQHNQPPERYVIFDPKTDSRHVFFAVESFKKYGELSGRTLSDMISGERSEKATNKRNPMDFVLWKPSSGKQPGWESPWGYGRPGWHIECSAMALDLLGESFDIHGGGLDLQFPHHENEIAQSACAVPHGDFARVWMHNEMLQVEGKKMSKSLGNFFTVHDLLEQEIPGEVIRFVLLSTHYRSPMDWTEKKVREAEATLRKWYQLAEMALDNAQPYSAVVAALSDDLNTSKAIAEMHQLAIAEDMSTLRASLGLMGFLESGIPEWAIQHEEEGSGYHIIYPQAISTEVGNTLVEVAKIIEREYILAKQSKDFAKIDIFKEFAGSKNISIGMSPLGIKLEFTKALNADDLRAMVIAAEALK